MKVIGVRLRELVSGGACIADMSIELGVSRQCISARLKRMGLRAAVREAVPNKYGETGYCKHCAIQFHKKSTETQFCSRRCYFGDERERRSESRT
jgi:hypothetical protein